MWMDNLSPEKDFNSFLTLKTWNYWKIGARM